MWNLIIPAVASLVGGALAGEGGKAAAKAQQSAADQNVALQRDVYQDQRNLARPGYMTGGSAANALAAISGLPAQDYAAAYGAGASGADDQWASYLTANPDVAAEWSRLQTQGKNQFQTPAEFAQYHYNTFGRNEGRTLPTATPAAAGPGGTSANALASPMAAFEASPYAKIATSGFRGVDVPEVNSAYARGGKVVSGAQSIALDERGKARLGGAYTDYTNGLRSLAGLNQTASNQVGGAASSYGANAGNAITAAGDAKANALGSAYKGLGQGVSGAVNALGEFGKKQWGWA